MWKILPRLGATTMQKKRIPLAICAQFRNEADFLDEWLSFHVAQGVRKFFLYDHGSSDHYREVLKPWRESGVVSLRKVGRKTQEQVYDDCLQREKKRLEWLGFIDIDEFLYNPSGDSLPDTLKGFPTAAAIFVFWKLFGPEGKQAPGPRGVLESFTRGLDFPKDSEVAMEQLNDWFSIRGDSLLTGCPLQVKSVVRPGQVMEMGVHFPVKWSGVIVDEQGLGIADEAEVKTLYTSTRAPTRQVVAINHYWSRGQALVEEKLGKPGTARIFGLTALPRPSPEQARAWESRLQGEVDLGILRVWRRTSAPYVFLIGFNKTATRAFASFFEDNGFPAVHWDENRLVEKMLDNLSAGRKILAGYDETYRFFSDFIFFTSEKRVEGNRFFREMDRDYPGSFFILNNRRTEDWLTSREKHNQGRFLELNLSQHGTTDAEVIRRIWREEKEQHEAEVRKYFHGREDFLEIDIDSPEVPHQVASLLGMSLDASRWRVIGRTVDIGAYEKTRR